MTEAILREGCQQGWPESRTLDFKRELPGTDDKSKHEFLKDICAFANADGGDLVYGVQERPAGHAEQLVPISVTTHGVDATKRRLAQILESGLEPSVAGVTMHPVTMESGDFVLVVRVPASFQRPHRYWHKDHWRWVVRVDTHTVDLTYDQIRDAFDRGATLAERARRFRAERLSGVLSGTTGRPMRAGPCCVVHLIPMSAMAGRTALDFASTYHQGYVEFIMTGWGGGGREFNLDGLAIYPSKETEDITYVQAFRTGALEYVRWAGMLYPEDDRHKTAIPAGDVSAYIREALEKLLAAAIRWGITGPAIVSVALLNLNGYRFWHMPQGGYSKFLAADRSNLILPETWIEQLGAIQGVDEVAKPLLDTLWQAFGIERCMIYHPSSGKWLYG